MQTDGSGNGPRAAPEISAVVPAKDEAESLGSLHPELVAALDALGPSWEIVYVDDGSTDGTAAEMSRLAAGDDRVRVVRLARNYGQSTATIAGAEAARGRWIATLDADGQNDPRDLRLLWGPIAAGEADVVTGVRRARVDPWLKRLSSRIANAVRNRLTGDGITDVGCSLRIVPREGLLSVVRFEGMHRFLPTLLRMEGCTVVERSVSHRPRIAGTSKYGIGNRLWRGLADLYVVRRLGRRRIDYELAAAPEPPAGETGGPSAPGA